MRFDSAPWRVGLKHINAEVSKSEFLDGLQELIYRIEKTADLPT